MTPLSRALLAIAAGLSVYASVSAAPTTESSQAAAQATNLPAAPSGYEWYVSKNGVGTFLRPNGWFIKEESVKNTNALFISKRDFSASGRIDIGLSVNQINDFSKHHSIAPSVYAPKFIGTLTAQKESIKAGTVKGNKADMHFAQVRGSNNGKMTVMHYIAVGNDEKDVMYLLFFEAPEKEWEQEIKTAGPMLNMFGLGP